MRVLNCCLALVLGTSASSSSYAAAAAAAASTGGRQVRLRNNVNNNINSNGNGKKAKANTDQQQQASGISSSFVLADKVAALSPSDKHRLEQLLVSSGHSSAVDVNVDVDALINDNDNTNTNNNHNQGHRKTMKAEQSDADLYISNNANAEDEDGKGEAVQNPEDVKADPRELPLPTDDEGENAAGENDAAADGVNGDEADTTSDSTAGNNGNNDGNNDDGRWTDASDDWKMNSPSDNDNDNGEGTGGTGANGTDNNNGENTGNEEGGIDNNADAGAGDGTDAEETGGSGTESIFDNNGNDGEGDSENNNNGSNNPSNNADSKPTFPMDADRCEVSDATTGLFGSTSDPESNSGLAKSTIVRYTYEVEFDLSKVERLMKALPKMEDALSDALVPTMFAECAEELADGNDQLDNGWVKPPPGVEVSSERQRERNGEDGLRRRAETAEADYAAAMKLIRRAKEIDGVVGFSAAPEDRVVGGEPCSVLNPPVANGCIKVEGQLTLHLAQDADDRRAVEATQDVIATTMANGDLADVDPSIIAVEYVADGLYEPATTQVTLNSSDESNQGGGGGSFPYAIAGGAAAALVGVALIGVGVKKHRNKNSDDDEDSEGYGIDEMGSSIPDELNSTDEHDIGKESAYDMAKLASPQSSHMTFDTTEISDPSTTMSSPGPIMNESALVSVNESAMISTSADLGPIIEMPSNEEMDADGKLGIERPYNDESEFVGVGIAQQLDDCDNHSTLFGTQHHGQGGSVTGSRSAQSGAGSLASVDGRGSILNDIV